MNRKIEKYVKSTNEGGGFDVRVSDSIGPHVPLASHSHGGGRVTGIEPILEADNAGRTRRACRQGAPMFDG